jgi:hypothetical protein
MKKYKITIALALTTMLLCSGMTCSTSSQRTAYNSIFTVEQTASTAVDGYYALVIKGVVKTNDVPAVSLRFNQFQAAATIAATTSAAGTNAIAPASLSAELADLLAFISTLTATK